MEVKNTTLSEYVKDKIREKGFDPDDKTNKGAAREIARRTGLSHTTVLKLINGETIFPCCFREAGHGYRWRREFYSYNIHKCVYKVSEEVGKSDVHAYTSNGPVGGVKSSVYLAILLRRHSST
jgi:hypothetical protein